MSEQFTPESISFHIGEGGTICAVNNYPAGKYKFDLWDIHARKNFSSGWNHKENSYTFPKITQDSSYHLKALIPDSDGIKTVIFHRFSVVDGKYRSDEKESIADSAGRTPLFLYSVNSCPVCGDAMSSVVDGQNCTRCGSSARLRSLAPIVNQYLPQAIKDSRIVDSPLLVFAMTAQERKILVRFFRKFKSVSLFGNYASDHESGVDLRDLSRYAPDSFSGVFGCLVFDYFPEHERALRECFRVIAPGGVFFTFIAPYRLVEGDLAPFLKGTIKSRPGYFDYLPDKVELPDVKVGRDWFVTAMKHAGFEPVIVPVRDAASGLVCEWFVGIKPGESVSSGLPLPVRVNESRVEAILSEVFRSIIPFGPEGFASLTIELIQPPSFSLLFLEDHIVPSPDGGGEVREIVATNGSCNEIWLSRDLGKSWMRKYEAVPWDSQIRAAFSLSDDGRLIRTFSGRMYHFDAQDRLVGCCETGMWPWHGSQGIGQSVAGTVMYAEYAPLQETDGVQEISVWRYRPDDVAQGWRKVLTLPASVRPPAGQLRHFHVCCPHPVEPNPWILASGDSGAHCRLWHSFDEGDTWTEVEIPQQVFPDIPTEDCPQILRFTQFSVMENGDLIWGTDDNRKGSTRSALIRMVMTHKDTPSFQMLGWLNKNCIRNISSYGNRLFLLLSESKSDTSAADCILYDAATNRITSLLLPNIRQKRASVTDSLGSGRLVNGIGFYPAQGVVLMEPDKRGIFRIRIEEKAS
jgi:SAM-dependent methyltransferase